MNKNKNKKKLNAGQIIAIVIVLAIGAPQLLGIVLVLGIIALPIYLIFRASKTKSSAPTQKTDNFDDCPQPLFCFHSDKGEHHVRGGKEVDPWDRPDIDIRKYQRRQ